MSAKHTSERDPTLRLIEIVGRNQQIESIGSVASSFRQVTGQFHVKAVASEHRAHQRSDSPLSIDDEGTLAHL
jgi:hypothetical protein